VCPSCGYTLRTPAVSKVGVAILLLALILVGAYVAGPQALIPKNGWIPDDIVDLTVANFVWLTLGAILLGMLLTAAGAFVIRSEQTRGPA